MVSPRQPFEARSSTAQIRLRQLCSPGSRPITFTLRRVSTLSRYRHNGDLRHSFAVRQLIGWYRQGADVDARLPLLSAVLGHVNPASTYWYLQAAPELLALAAQRLQTIPGGPQ